MRSMFQWRLKVVPSILTKKKRAALEYGKIIQFLPGVTDVFILFQPEAHQLGKSTVCQQETATFLKSSTVNDQIKSENFFQTVKFRKKKTPAFRLR